MAENISEGIIMTDRDCRVLVINLAAKKALGLEQKQDVSIEDIISCLQGKLDIREKIKECFKANETIEIPEVPLNDRSLHVVVSPARNPGANGEDVVGGIIILHDITGDADRARLREDATAMTVHELRSPLFGITSMVELMKEEPEQTEERYFRNMSTIQDASTRMLEIVNDLLDVAKIEAGNVRINSVPSSLPGLIETQINFFGAFAKKENIILEACLDKALPAQASFDPKAISQILNNLISNAIKFTLAGGRVTVQALFHKKGESLAAEIERAGIKWFLVPDDNHIFSLPDAIVVAVTDSGVGISSENMGNLFKKFRQFSPTKSGKNGTGLGLVVAKGLVEAHKGMIGVASKEGVGSTFYFTIPMQAAG